MVMYALCKHGPNCQRHQRSKCGFAHRINELSLPHEVFPNRFVDESDVREGRAGIDVWFGQTYTLAQHSRLRLYIEHEEPPFPDWLRMYLWFYGKEKDSPSKYEDFGLMERIRDDLLPKWNRVRQRRPVAVSDLETWNAPFEWQADEYDEPFYKRLIEHCCQVVAYDVLTVKEAIDMSWYRADTSMHWGADSKRYFDLVPGERYVLIDESKGEVGSGWYWVAHYDSPHVCAWASPSHFERQRDKKKYRRLNPGHMTPSMEEWKSAEWSSHSIAKRFWHTAPDGTDLDKLPKLAVCFSDASVCDRVGFAVSFLCSMPTKEEWSMPCCAHKLYVCGSEAPELTGCILNLYVLKGRPWSWETAILYVDNNKVPLHVGDHTRPAVSPTLPCGWVLYPLIRLAIRLLRELAKEKKYVLLQQLNRKYMICDKLAKECMRTARDNNWTHPPGSASMSIVGQKRLKEALDEVSENQKKLERGGFSSRMYKQDWDLWFSARK